LRFYGLDLRREIETMGVRRLFALVQGLPLDAATWREERTWTQRDELAALQVELTDVWGRLIFSALGGKPKGKPLRIARPAQQAEEKQITSDPGEIARWFRQNVR
jgi:hypothetical protein